MSYTPCLPKTCQPFCCNEVERLHNSLAIKLYKGMLENSPIKISVNITKYKAKVYHYTQESYFQEFWYKLLDHFSEKNILLLNEYTFVIFKPDAALGRCVNRTLNYLRENGLDAVYYILFRFNRYSIRELWRYELNGSSRQRYSVIDRLLQNADSVFVLFKRNKTITESACEQISNMKGPSIASQRLSHHIRSVINAYDGTLNFIHTPDEVIDMIREIGVLFDDEEQMKIIEKIIESQRKKCQLNQEDLEERFYASMPYCDYNLKKLIVGFTEEVPPQDINFFNEKGKLWVAKHLGEILSKNTNLNWWEQTVLIAYSMFPNSENVERILKYEEREFFN